MGWRGVLSLVAAGVLMSAPGRANPVNAEMLRLGDAEAGLSISARGRLALARGNLDLLDIGGAARLEHATLHPTGQEAPPAVARRLVLIGSARFAERADTPFVDQGFGHARWIEMWHRRIGADVFAQYGFDRFRRLTARAVAGGGVRAVLLPGRMLSVWGGSGYMFEYNRIDVADGAPDAPETFDHRTTHYLSVRLGLFEQRLLVQNTLYVQPLIVDAADVRALDALDVMARVHPQFALGLSASLHYDSDPPTGVETTDLRLGSTVRLDF